MTDEPDDTVDDLPASLGANLVVGLDHAEIAALHGLIQSRDPAWAALLTAIFGLATPRADSEQWASTRISSVMRRIGGRVQRGTRRALWVHGGVATTQQLLEWCYPRDPAGRDRRQRKNRARWVCLTARKMAVRIGRVWPGGNVWKMNDELMKR
jgi:hypothetical protein